MFQNLKKAGRAVVSVKAAIIGGGVAFAAQSSFAVATPVDLTSITSAVDISTVAAGMVAMGAIMILPGVAKWAAKKLATFFG
jgi:hypothetical protein